MLDITQLTKKYNAAHGPNDFDPLRRLVAAVLLRAVFDISGRPTQKRVEALDFLTDPEVESLMTDAFKFPREKIREVLGCDDPQV